MCITRSGLFCLALSHFALSSLISSRTTSSSFCCHMLHCIVFSPSLPFGAVPRWCLSPKPFAHQMASTLAKPQTPHHLVCCKSMPAIPGWMLCQQAVPGWALHTNFLACIVPANMHLNSAWCFSQRSYRPSAQAPHVI